MSHNERLNETDNIFSIKLIQEIRYISKEIKSLQIIPKTYILSPIELRI